MKRLNTKALIQVIGLMALVLMISVLAVISMFLGAM